MLQKEMVKQHLRVDEDFDDGLIELYIKAAYERVEMHLDRAVIDDEAARKLPTDLVSNSVIDLAALKLVGHFYAQREIVLGSEVHILNEFYELLQPCRLLFREVSTG